MADSTAPALEVLANIISFLPSEENPEFRTCRGVTLKKARCRNPIAPEKSVKAGSLWADLANREAFPDNQDFYYKLETLLELTHCGKHLGDALGRCHSWKMQRPIDAASEDSAPGTPEPRSSVEFPSETDITPFSSPLAPDDTAWISSKSPGSDAANSFVQTPTRSATPSPGFPEETKGSDTADMISGRISTIEIIASPEKTICHASEAIVESVSAMTISDRDTSHESRRFVSTETTPEAISTTTITVKGETNTTNATGKGPTEDARVVGLGLITTLQRKGSLRDDSPVIRELYKYLTPQQFEDGVVYVLEHTLTPGLFKIGWTRTSVHERLAQPGNCYSKDTKVLHETSSGPFAGASKAERLAQVILRHQNVRFVECEQCGGGHREWFSASKDEVLRTVKLMEDFLQRPAYELCQGEMKLSRDANAFIKAMCSFSTVRLESLMAGADNDVKDSIESTWSAGVQVPAPQVQADPCVQESRGEDEQSSSAAHFADRPKPSRRSLGTKVGTGFGTTARQLRGFTGKAKDKVDRLLGRSRESTPEPEDASLTDLSSGDADKPNGAQELMVKFLWSLLPEDSKPDKGVTGDGGPRDMAALRAVVRQMTDEFCEDFKTAYQRDDDGQGAKEAEKVL